MLGYQVIPVIDQSRGSMSTSWIAAESRLFPAPGDSHIRNRIGKREQGRKGGKERADGSPLCGAGRHVERSPAEVEALYEARYQGHKLFGNALQTLEQRYWKHQVK